MFCTDRSWWILSIPGLLTGVNWTVHCFDWKLFLLVQRDSTWWWSCNKKCFKNVQLPFCFHLPIVRNVIHCNDFSYQSKSWENQEWVRWIYEIDHWLQEIILDKVIFDVATVMLDANRKNIKNHRLHLKFVMRIFDHQKWSWK